MVKKIVETSPQNVSIKDTQVTVKTVMEYEDETPPPICPAGQCKDPATLQCRLPLPNETIDANGFCKVITPPPNNPPISDAGIDQTVAAKSNVTLDGSKSYDPDGDAITYQWRQTSGPAVQLNNTTSQVTTFVAPDITEPPTDEIKLTPTSIVASSQDSGKEANKVNDGDFETRWSADGDGEWIEFTFPQNCNFTKVKLTGYWYNRTYNFEVGGQRFSNPANRPANTLQEYDISSLNLTGNKLRIIGHGNSDSSYNSYREIQVWGKIGGGPIPPPDQAVAKLDLPSTAEPLQTNVRADASQSVADTVDITETTSEGIQLRDAGRWIKEFDIPDRNNFSIGIQAKAAKGTSQSIVQKAIQVSKSEPGGDVLWDSNVHLKVTQETRVTDTFGSQEINGKGVFMAASGSPRLIIRPNGEFDLEAGSGHGRVYIQCQNYNCYYEGEVRFNDNAIRNTTWRLRSRHGEGGDCPNRFGGFGATCEMEEQLAEYATESCHNNHENTIKKALAKKMVVGEWLKFRFYVCDSADRKSVRFKTEYDYNDGLGWRTVLTGSHNSPQDYYMAEDDFLVKRSYTWLRINNESTGKVTYRNVKIIKLQRGALDSVNLMRGAGIKNIQYGGRSADEEGCDDEGLSRKSVEAPQPPFGDATGGNVLTFELKVTDSKGATNTDTTTVTVSQEPPPPPICPEGQCKDPVTQQCRPIGINETVDENGFCKTIPPPPPGVLKIGHIGDTHGRSGGHTGIKNMFEREQVNFMIHSGDITDDESSADAYVNFMKSLGKEYGKDFANAQGNHSSSEEGGEGAQADMENAYPVLKTSKWLQFYHIKNVVIIFGNTQIPNYSQMDSEASAHVQQSLVKAKQLKDSGQADWVIFVQHKPMYVIRNAGHSAEYNFRYNFHPLFDQYGVDIYCNGHTHLEHRTLPLIFGGEGTNVPPKVNSAMKNGAHDMSVVPSGTICCINGSSTKSHSLDEETNPWTAFASDSGNAYTVFEIDGKNLTGKYIDISSGNVRHEFKATKTGVPPPVTCPAGQCKDPITKLCRPIGANETVDPVTNECKPVQPPPSGLKFNISGDFRDTPESGDNLISDKPDVILSTGDYGIGTPASEWCNQVMKRWKDSGIETWGALGNHDNNQYLSQNFFKNTSWEWTVKKSSIAFIAANTISENVSDCNTRLQECQNDPNIKTIIVLMHESIFHTPNTSVSSDTTIEFHNTFKKYNKVKLVIAGHTHVYGRMKPNTGDIDANILYLLNGIGGQSPSTGSTAPSPMHKINGALHCVLNQDDGSITCKCVPNQGDAPQIMDTFTIGANGELPTDGVIGERRD